MMRHTSPLDQLHRRVFLLVRRILTLQAVFDPVRSALLLLAPSYLACHVVEVVNGFLLFLWLGLHDQMRDQQDVVADADLAAAFAAAQELEWVCVAFDAAAVIRRHLNDHEGLADALQLLRGITYVS